MINLINGLFGTDYPTNSNITYNWTEHEDKELKRTLSDSILTINNRDSYHIEAQMTEDEEIVFRVFEYGFGHAYKNRIIENSGERMIFPRPCIMYLDEGNREKLPDEYTLVLEFEKQGEFSYKVPVVKLQDISISELDSKKLIILFPFLLLRLRKKLEKVRTKESVEELQRLVMDDILSAIDRNEEAGNISQTDAYHLKALTNMLYMQIYSEYKELEELTVKLYDQSLELPGDKYEKTVEELEDEVKVLEDEVKELDSLLGEKDALIRQLQQRLGQV